MKPAKKALDEALQKERDAYKALATSENAIALGTNAKVSGENSIMLGAQSDEKAALVTKNSVVLGANSSQVIGGVSENEDKSALQDYDKGEF